MAACANGHEVQAGDRFCGKCGWAVPAHCPFGHPAQPHQRYCPDCGAALDGTVLPLRAEAHQPARTPPAFAAAPGAAAPPSAVSPSAPVAAAPAFLTSAPAAAAPPFPPSAPVAGPPLDAPSRSVFATGGGPPGPYPVELAPRELADPYAAGWSQREAERKKSWSSGAVFAALVAGIIVIVFLGLASYALASAGSDGGGGGSTVPGITSPSSTGRATSGPSPTRHMPSPVSPSTTIPSTTSPSPEPPTTAPQPSASTTGEGPAALTGSWSGHGGGLQIQADGHGEATFRAYRFCSQDPTPPCDTQNGNNVVAGGNATFVLTAPGTGPSSSGRVTDSNDPSAFQPGFAMTVTLIPGDVVLVSSSPSAQSVAYCGPRASPSTCGT